jgi:type I restriction enzyme, S subunit
MSENNNIPNHWQIKKLGEVFKVSSGKGLKVNNLQGGNFPVYGGNGINGYHTEYLIESPKLIIGRVGVKCGVTHITKPKSWVTDNALIVEPIISDFDMKFFKLKLEYENLNKLSVSTAQPVISGSKIYEYEILLPPLPEQQLIVSHIEELLSDLENGKQQLHTAQQQLKVYRQSLLKWAFEGKLTNNNVKDGELPNGWKWVKNKDLLKYVTSGSRDWKQYYSTKGSHFVRTQDINSNKLDIGKTAFVNLPEKVEGKRSLIEESDILMTITGANVGKVAVVDFPIKDAYVSQSVALLKYYDTRITKYLWYYFQAQGFGKSFIDKLVYGVGRPVLSLENMREVDILICPIEDQRQIIEELESKLTVCDKIEETISQSLLQAESLRQSILKKAFSGELVKNQVNP